MLELKNMLFQSFYIWVATFNSLPVSYFYKFLDLCSSFFPILGGFFCVLLVPICAFNEIELLVRKKHG
jgi:hypothetical protein